MSIPVYTDEQARLAEAITEWVNAGAPVQDVVYAIDSLIVARMSQVLKPEPPKEQ